VRSAYRLDGPADRPIITLSHALGATLRLWDDVALALAGRNRVLRYDVRGHGGSDVPRGPYTLAEMAEDVVELLDAQGIARTHFVGMSMGGLVGMALALGHPSRVQSLALCDTTACYGESRRQMWEDRLRMAETSGMTDELIELTMRFWFSDDHLAREKPRVDRVREMFRQMNPLGYAASVRAIASVDLTPRLAGIRCPTLVVVGGDDPGTPPAMSRVLAERIPGARLEVLPGVKHAAVVERAADFVRLLGDFIDAQPGT
jgi:3-oxoadipate enol-lactonase